jgi:hypothetical protein
VGVRYLTGSFFFSEVTREVARIQASGKPLPKESKYVDIYREKPIRVAVKVLVPIKEHPKVRSSLSQ